MPVVTIARQLGSGGGEIASLVASRLGARLLDHELLDLASAHAGIPLHYLEALDERGRSMLWRPVDLVRLVPLPPINPDLPDVTGDRYPPTGPIVARGEGLVSPAYWAMEAYATLLVRTMQAAAAEGDTVLVGRAGNVALADRKDALHVLITAGAPARLRRVMAAEGLDGYNALERIQESDNKRRAYARQFFQSDWLDPQRYSLVVNTDHLSIEAAADIIDGAARAMAAPSNPAVTGAPETAATAAA